MKGCWHLHPFHSQQQPPGTPGLEGRACSCVQGAGPLGHLGRRQVTERRQFPHLAEGSAWCFISRTSASGGWMLQFSESFWRETLTDSNQSGLCLEVSIWENKNGDKDLCASSFIWRQSKETPAEREGEAAGEGALSKVDCSAYGELSPPGSLEAMLSPHGSRKLVDLSGKHHGCLNECSSHGP